MIVEKYYVKDIKEYEESTGKSVISILKDQDFDGLVDLIRLGIPRKPSKDTCYDILDSYLLQGHDLLDVFEEVRQCLFGDQMTEEEQENGINLEEFRNLTDAYNKMCFDIMSIGISYNEFWSFSTKDMYDAFNSCTQKMENDINRQLSLAYNSAAMIGASVWGKLPKKVPHVDLVDHSNEIVNTEYGEMTRGEYNDLVKMQALMGINGNQ